MLPRAAGSADGGSTDTGSTDAGSTDGGNTERRARYRQRVGAWPSVSAAGVGAVGVRVSDEDDDAATARESAQRTFFVAALAAAATVGARPAQTAVLGKLGLRTAAGSVRGGGGVIIGAITLVGDHPTCDQVAPSLPAGRTSALPLGVVGWVVGLVACLCVVSTGGAGSRSCDSTLSRCMKWSRLALMGCLLRIGRRSGWKGEATLASLVKRGVVTVSQRHDSMGASRPRRQGSKATRRRQKLGGVT